MDLVLDESIRILVKHIKEVKKRRKRRKKKNQKLEKTLVVVGGAYA